MRSPSPPELLFRDPRHFLRSAGSYDLILVAMPDPASGQSNRFYTEEFFRQCARRLTANGVLAFRAASSENLWTPHGSIYRALQAAFPHIVVLPGVSNIFLASRGKLSRDPDELAGRLEARGIKARLMSRPYIRYLCTNDRFQQVRQSLEGSAAPMNTDERPICYQLTVVLWLSKFFPGLALVDLDRITSLNILGFRTLWLPLSALLVLLSLAGRRPGCRRVVLAGMAGFMGMVLETILILQYQAGNGALYQDIGILLMSFMAGLSLGAWIVDRLPETWRRRRRVGLALIVGFALTGAAIGRGIETGWLDTLAENGLFLVLSGILVSGLFAYAGTHEVEDSKSVLAPLYSADLVGGCIGAIGGSLVLVPLAGLSAAAILMVPVSLTCLALLAPR
ncbi:MAG: hypothetical protein FJW35_14365 [Acidobacteria bacterium]|nr:hypothetical protein [Acidobacteriota bacterium]